MLRPDDVVRTGPWPEGVQNRTRPYGVADGEVRNAVNVDFDGVGNFRRRNGYERVATLLDAHSGFACEHGVFAVSGNSLWRFDDNFAATWLTPVAGPVTYVSASDGRMYLSDGVSTFEYGDAELQQWGCDTPTAPVLSAGTGGTLDAGTYLVSVTMFDIVGREHGASPTGSVVVGAGGIVLLSSLPNPQAFGMSSLGVYCSSANGTVLRLAGVMSSGADSAVVSTDPGGGRELRTQFMTRMPAGSIVREFAGRLLMASGSVLWYSEPYAYSLLDPRKNFVQFASDITIVEPVEAGVFVCADKTYFLAGKDPSSWTQRKVLDYGAVLGTSVRNPENDVVWYGTDGVILAKQDGSVQNLTKPKVAIDTGTVGAGAYIERDGNRQYVASVQGGTVSTLAASDWMNMEVTRRGAVT